MGLKNCTNQKIHLSQQWNIEITYNNKTQAIIDLSETKSHNSAVLSLTIVETNTEEYSLYDVILKCIKLTDLHKNIFAT